MTLLDPTVNYPPQLPNVPAPEVVESWNGTLPAEPQSPLWWLLRLHKKLRDRAAVIDRFSCYYSGDHPVPWLPEEQREDFRHLLALSESNYMGLVVDTPVQRMHVEGFRFGGNEDGDEEASRIWQANNLDAGSRQGFLEAFIGGVAYWLVAPDPDDNQTPLITIEHGTQAIVEHVPGSNRRKRAAGLKVWVDEWTARTFATLYLPDWLYKVQAQPSNSSGDLRWSRRTVAGEPWPVRNPLRTVSLIEMPNRPRLLTGGVSELADVTVIQDRINKTIADRLMTQDFGAFPQKHVTGFEIDTDPETGQPVSPFKLGRNRLLVAESSDTTFGQFLPAPLDPYSLAKNEDVKDIASRTQTPAQYLLGEIVNISAEALKAAESGLVSKILDRREPFANAMEDVMRLAFRVVGDARALDTSAETIWRNPEFQLEAQVVDAAVKKQGLEVPLEQLWEDVGYSQEQIRRFKAAGGGSTQVATVQAQVAYAKQLMDEQGLDQAAAFAAVGLLNAADKMQSQTQTPPGAGTT